MTIYTVGYNTPGYLPEMEPAETTSVHVAKEYYISYAKEYLDAWDEECPCNWYDCLCESCDAVSDVHVILDLVSDEFVSCMNAQGSFEVTVRNGNQSVAFWAYKA